MSKDCRDCKNFSGYDDTGYPYCDIDGGTENCPYNDEIPRGPENGTQIVLDIEYFSEYIRSTMKNTFQREARKLAEQEIQHIARESYDETVRSITEAEITKIVSQQVDEFMKGDITVGGGWSEPSRTISRTQYMNDLIQKELEKKFSGSGIADTVQRTANETIEKFTRRMKDQINANIKRNFDDATRNTLTASVVNLLMANDTYKKLADNMTHMIGD